jgi:hypothetical protein
VNLKNIAFNRSRTNRGRGTAASGKLLPWSFRAALLLSAVLLIRFAIDFGERMSWWLVVPFWLLIIVTLIVAAIAVSGSQIAPVATQDRTLQRLVLTTIPLAFIASSLDCSGLKAFGCSPYCTFVKLVWIPLITAACITYHFSNNRFWLKAIFVMSFVPLAPHCVCYNVGNGWWIERLGASPLCYGWAFTVTLVATRTLIRAHGYWRSLTVSSLIITGAFVFFVAHHYFHYPW